MSKKIIAVFCTLVLIAAVFTACGKKKPEQINTGLGKFPAVTNENGEIVTNFQGQIAVYVTEEDGNYAKDANGEPMTQYEEKTFSLIVNPNNTVTREIFTVPVMDGWQVNEGETAGRIYKKDTDLKCYIDFSYAASETNDRTFETFMSATSNNNHTIVDAINSGTAAAGGYAKADMAEEETTFAGYKAYKAEYVIYDANGKIVHYAETVYFLYTAGDVYTAGDIYSVSYICEDGRGYDSGFDFFQWANSNIKIKEPVKK